MIDTIDRDVDDEHGQDDITDDGPHEVLCPPNDARAQQPINAQMRRG